MRRSHLAGGLALTLGAPGNNPNMKNPTRVMKEWRQFELLISRLEAVLSPEGYIFTSPDKLIDYDTNELREVDCSIRYKQDGIEKTISVECRKRGSTQDVTWIEQLACKKESLRLSGTIAVSSNGFSSSAKLKAKKRGITLNTYKEIQAKDIADGFKPALHFKHISRQGRLISIEFETQDDSPEIPENLMEQFRNDIEKNSGLAPILLDRKTNEKINLRQILEECLYRSTNLGPGTTIKTYVLRFEPNTVVIADFPIVVYLHNFKLKVEVDSKERILENITLGQYEHDEEILLEVASGIIESSESGKRKIEVYYRRDEGGG